MHITDPMELLYLALLLRWEKTAPQDKHQGRLDGKSERNTQVTRMAYVLQKVWNDVGERLPEILSRYSRRDDGKSYISKDFSWMVEPFPLQNGWYLEGCMDLGRKQMILQHLTACGLSTEFAACVDDFVAGKSVEGYFPDENDREVVFRKMLRHEGDTE